MSAFVVDREHIVYLVQAVDALDRYRDGIRWRHNGESHRLRPGDYDKMVEIANMLWQENIASIKYRYPDCVSAPQNMPGPLGESYLITQEDFARTFRHIDPVQVLASCHCYSYQSCEHPEWEGSEAYAFIQALEGRAVRSLPGYDNTIWGSPERK